MGRGGGGAVWPGGGNQSYFGLSYARLNGLSVRDCRIGVSVRVRAVKLRVGVKAGIKENCSSNISN